MEVRVCPRLVTDANVPLGVQKAHQFTINVGERKKAAASTRNLMAAVAGGGGAFRRPTSQASPKGK
jgi:hypothetical protein